MIIGIPKEIMHDEARVACTPETVNKFVKDGFTVLVEKAAGNGALYHDEDYVKAGAELIDKAQDVYDRAEVILKVKEPQFNGQLGKHEVDMMHQGQYLITFIHPASPVNHDMVKKLSAKGVIAITLDGIPRISRAQNLDALTSMSTCAGYKGILMAADKLTTFMPQMFTAVGKIEPAKVMVIGVGVAGLQALATAKRLGAVTYAADIRPAAAEQAGSLGAKVIDTTVPAELAIAEGGYANRLPDDVLAKERKALEETIQQMDIVFCSALIPGKVAPIIITEDTVKGMKRGAVIVDISIDQGGNCELTPAGDIINKHGVTLMGVKNIPGLLPTSSTWMFSNNMYNLVKYIVKDGKVNLDRSDEVIAKSLVCIDGQLVHAGAREAMGL
ncbi:NAD(P) transhydrogenase subunit alpha [Hoylesella marshii]|uniref:NAD(P) transhydrogenase subunit alpha n=1 Tax=Hoylesella marshii TaxID=189722 RepID=UPI0028D695E2|nr:NAD(P) transhydrogenase subunit alpha [Hoylesella marshii]